METPKSSPLVPRVACALVVLLAAASARAHLGLDRQIQDLSMQIAEAPSATLYVQRAELHRLHRDWTSAETDLQAAAKLDANLAEVQLELGELRLDAGRPADAVLALDAFLTQRPDSSRGHAARARALGALGRHLAAADDWTRAIETAGSGIAGPGYYLERARALAAAGPQYRAQAVRGLDEGLAALGEPVTLQLYAVELEVELERWDAALARLDRIAAHSARKETWLVRRGEILERAGRPDEALEAYNAALTAVDGLQTGRRHSRATQRVAEAARHGVDRLTTGRN